MAEGRTPLHGSVPRNRHRRIGPADPLGRIDITIKLRRKCEDGLPTIDEFIAGKRGPGLTRQALADCHGGAQEDADAVQRWAAGFGLSVWRVELRSRQMHLTGSVAAMERAFGVTLSMHEHDRTGTLFRCHECEVHVPESLGAIITGVFGLNDMPVAVRHSTRAVQTAAAVSDPKTLHPGAFYPHEVAKLYNFPPTRGKGQKVALIQLGGAFDTAVLHDYFTRVIGLAEAPVVNAIPVLNAPMDFASPYTGEVYLDIEIVGAMAPGATIDVYFSQWTGEGYLAAIEQAIHNDDYAAISISYGLDEDSPGNPGHLGWDAINQHVDEAFRDATALGVPIFVCSGDQGSSGNRYHLNTGQGSFTVSGHTPNAHVEYPACSPYATAVGGTLLYAKDGAIEREVVWNELGPLQQGQFYLGGATGGGVSDRYPQVPSYQTKAGIVPVSANAGGVCGRGVPDVAGNAGSTTGYLVTQPPGVQPSIMPVGGTSAAAPMWAALMACVREALSETFGGAIPVFFFNDFVYDIGRSAAFRDVVGGRAFGFVPGRGFTPGDFTDVGNNRSTEVDGYAAGPGYDHCTGWGSPNGVELLNQLTAWLKARQKPAG
jgi:kumamolisin